MQRCGAVRCGGAAKMSTSYIYYLCLGGDVHCPCPRVGGEEAHERQLGADRLPAASGCAHQHVRVAVVELLEHLIGSVNVNANTTKKRQKNDTTAALVSGGSATKHRAFTATLRTLKRLLIGSLEQQTSKNTDTLTNFRRQEQEANTPPTVFGHTKLVCLHVSIAGFKL